MVWLSYGWKDSAGKACLMQTDNPMRAAPHSPHGGIGLALFRKKCAWCGAILSNPNYVERMSNRFCSEEHAQQYLEQERATGGAGGADGCS